MLQVPESFVREVATKQGVTQAELDALLLALNDCSGPEIARTLDISEAAVRKRLGESYRKFEIEGTGNKKLSNLKQRLFKVYEKGFANKPKVHHPQHDWGEAVDDEDFCGRDEQLKELTKWITGDTTGIGQAAQRCRLIGILGLGGVGKTALAAKIARDLRDQFEYVIWRSLRNAPPLSDILAELLCFLPSSKDGDLPDTENSRILRLIESLREHRCLIILDNVESVLRSGEGKSYEIAGDYEEGYENYGYLFKKMGEADHKSCLILTGREKPKEVAALEGKKLPIKVLQLTGLSLAEAHNVLKDKGFTCSDEDLKQLVERYSGNPLALKIAATTIYNLFNNDVVAFLNQISQGKAIYGDIRTLLDQQFDRLSDMEKRVMYQLAISEQNLSLAALSRDIPGPAPLNQPLFLPTVNLIDAAESLVRRSLVEREAGTRKLQQQAIVREYMTEKARDQLAEKGVSREKPDLLVLVKEGII